MYDSGIVALMRIQAVSVACLLAAVGTVAPTVSANEEQPIIDTFAGVIGDVDCQGTITVTEETGLTGEGDTANPWGARALMKIIRKLSGFEDDFAYKNYGPANDWAYECTASSLHVGATGIKGENREVIVTVQDNGEEIQAACTYSGAHSFDDRCTAVVEVPVEGVLDEGHGHYEDGEGNPPQHIDFCVDADAKAINRAAAEDAAVVGQLLEGSGVPSHEVTFEMKNPDGVCSGKVYIEWTVQDSLKQT